MDKTTLELLINSGCSQREMALELNCSQGNVKYWLKKFELKTQRSGIDYKNRVDKKCPKCELIKPLACFYKRTNRTGYNGYCKKCSKKYHTARVKRVKIKMVQYKGGGCVDCDLKLEDSHYCVFDFHHINPEDKDPNFDRIKFQKWDKITTELDKCVCLCANCHRLRHAQIAGW